MVLDFIEILKVITDIIGLANSISFSKKHAGFRASAT